MNLESFAVYVGRRSRVIYVSVVINLSNIRHTHTILYCGYIKKYNTAALISIVLKPDK